MTHSLSLEQYYTMILRHISLQYFNLKIFILKINWIYLPKLKENKKQYFNFCYIYISNNNFNTKRRKFISQKGIYDLLFFLSLEKKIDNSYKYKTHSSWSPKPSHKELSLK